MRENEVSASSCIRLFARRPVIYFLRVHAAANSSIVHREQTPQTPENKKRPTNMLPQTEAVC
jgi:hypothetical protein